MDLVVIDGYDNTGIDTINITVIDTGIVKGIVIDENGDPVEGAKVEIISLNGNIYTATTESGGSVSIEIFYGDFTWTITKDGYEPISGTGLVNAMEETELDLSDQPMIKEDEGKNVPSIIPFLVLGLLIILIVGAILFFVLRKKKAQEESVTSPPQEESETPEGEVTPIDETPPIDPISEEKPDGLKDSAFYKNHDPPHI